MRVLISDRVDPGCVDVLQAGGRIEAEVSTGLSPDQLLERIDAYEGLIVRSATRVTGEVIRRAGRMRAIGRAGAGVDNIDVDAATRRGIVVMNTPGGNSVSTAEHTLAMILALARNVPQGTASVKAGRWERGDLTGVELAGKTIGVFGLGQVGREVAQRTSALGLRVLAFDPPVTEEVAQSYGAQLAPEEQIWQEADFLTFHVPLTPQTRHRLSARELDLCRDGVRVVNCAAAGSSTRRPSSRPSTRARWPAPPWTSSRTSRPRPAPGWWPTSGSSAPPTWRRRRGRPRAAWPCRWPPRCGTC